MTHEEKFKDLLEAGVHFGHLKRKWNPRMAPYIFDEKKGIHIIDLHKTIAQLDETCAAIKQMVKSGKKILFVATKKQAKDIVAEMAGEVNMPYVTERWSGGMLTNFSTIRRAIRKMAAIDKMEEDGTLKTMSKRERLFVSRQRAKMEKNLGSIADLTRVPSALFVVDIHKEHIAISEAKKLGITTFAMVDTNSDPSEVDFAIPSNDDATKSIEKIMSIVTQAIKDGLAERKVEKDKRTEEKKAEEAESKKATEEAPAKAKKEEAVKAEPAKEKKAAPKAKKEEKPKADDKKEEEETVSESSDKK